MFGRKRIKELEDEVFRCRKEISKVNAKVRKYERKPSIYRITMMNNTLREFKADQVLNDGEGLVYSLNEDVVFMAHFSNIMDVSVESID